MLGGLIGTVLGWLGYHVGQRTDGANASGIRLGSSETI